MNVSVAKKTTEYYEFLIHDEDRQVARGYLFIIRNLLHTEPYGFMEDIYVESDCRSLGYGSEIVQGIIQKAKDLGCYKLIATSRTGRPKVHDLYKKIGFEQYGVEFRMNFTP
jgi:GNAT superfamily N-acetyltransferase